MAYFLMCIVYCMYVSTASQFNTPKIKSARSCQNNFHLGTKVFSWKVPMCEIFDRSDFHDKVFLGKWLQG
jgi:hypothetical protein